MKSIFLALPKAKPVRAILFLVLALFLAACGTNPQLEDALTNDDPLEAQGVWTKIADEKTRFDVSGTQRVRYGVDSSWIEKSVTERGYCGNWFFGSDPARGVVKHCEVFALAAPSNPEPEPTDPAPTPQGSGPTVTVNFQKDNSNFTNPERGFSNPQVSYSDDPKPLESWRLEQSKEQGISVINRRYAMVSFRNSAISQGYLEHIQNDLDKVREHGIKMVIRFSYTFNESGSHADAPLSRILSHVEQLRPLLQRNADVIAYLEAGFIGRWGEWNKSSNGLGDETNPQNVNAQSQLVNALLDALPDERMVTLRYLSRKKAILSNNPLNADQAYSGSDQARTGHINDYFTIDDWSGGDREYLNQDTRYTVQGGEPIRLNGRRSECGPVLDELETFHWSTMNIPGSNFTDVWRDGGCYDTIAKRLGYRYFLTKATLPRSVTPDGTLSVGLTMTNEGFANLYNPRGLELVLRNKSNDQETRLEIDTEQDVRLLLPSAGETEDITLSTVLPDNLASGEYELFLSLPDPSSGLKDRAAYSIRLANTNVWESETGYNKLGEVNVN